MTRIFISSLICGLLLSLTAVAQNKRLPIRRPVTRNLAVQKADELPQITDYAFVISIDRFGNSILKVQRNETVDSLTISQVEEFFDKFLILQNSKKPGAPKYLDPIVVIKPDADIELGTVIKVIIAARVSYNSRIKVDAGNDIFLMVPKKPNYPISINIKPNPLMLVVRLNEQRAITLNNEASGRLSDTSPLTEKLKRIFRAREDNGVFREGTNEVEKTVFLKMPMSAKFADVMKTAQALKNAGAEPIGLQVDDPEPPVLDSRKDLVMIR